MIKVKSKQTVVLHGSKTDPEVKASMEKLKAQGREVTIEPRPTYDTGLGPCGKSLCHCEGVCMENYHSLEKKFS